MPDFPYINARVRAMKSRLLDPGRMEELLAVPTLDAFIQALNNTPYGHDLQEALSRYATLQAVDVALARNFYNTTTKVLSFADGKPRALIEVVLMRWDLINLRIILRGKHSGVHQDDIASSLIPAGSLGEAALREWCVGKPSTAGSGFLSHLSWCQPRPRIHAPGPALAAASLTMARTSSQFLTLMRFSTIRASPTPVKCP